MLSRGCLFFVLLQERGSVESKLDVPPLSGHAGISPATQIWGNSLQDYPLFAGETIGTRIDRGNSFIMSLRLRGGYATECHAFSYYPSNSALIFSPPCGSCSVFKVTHFVYKYAWFLKKCRKNIKNSAKIALKYLQNYFIYNIIQNEPASQRSVFCSKGG